MVSSIQVSNEQRIYNHVAMHILFSGLAEGYSDRIAQDIGVDAEIVRSIMRRWESEGRLTKHRCCPDCLAVYQLSEQEFPIKMLIDGEEIAGASIIDGSLMAMLGEEWVTLPMPEHIYKPFDLPHRGYGTPGQGVIDPDDIDWEDWNAASARFLEMKLYPDEFPRTRGELTKEQWDEMVAEIDAQYNEAERRTEAEREQRATGSYREGLGKIVLWRCDAGIRF